MNKSFLKRMEKAEEKLEYKNKIPVVFIDPHAEEVSDEIGVRLIVRSKEELKLFEHRISDRTVIFVDSLGDDYDEP